LDHRGGNVELGHELGEAGERQRRHLRRLDDHRVAGGQDGGHTLHAGPDRTIPGQDLGDHPHRLQPLVVGDRRIGHLGHTSGERHRFAAEEPQRVNGQVDGAMPEAVDGAAGIDHREEDQLIRVVLDRPRDALQRRCPLAGRGAAPRTGVERLACRSHSGYYIGLAGLRDTGDAAVVARRRRAEGLAIRGLTQLASDQQGVRLGAQVAPARVIREAIDRSRNGCCAGSHRCIYLRRC
jgi:hypothetical protein